jgi:pimeloyl-ACP methyl ester carboxylesterase
MKIPCISMLLSVLVLFSCSNGNSRRSDGMIDIGTHRLHLHREGEGAPVVVIDTGLGDTADNWAPLAARISRETLVCTYDRAGYGQSEPGPMPRTSNKEAAELRALLEAASITGPYILVGHSLGCLNAAAFADSFPQDVAGMILLDPPPLAWILGEGYPELRAMADGMTQQWERAAEEASSAPDAAARARGAFLETIASEHREMFGRSAETVAAIDTFGDIPLVVIAAGRPNPLFGDVAEEYQRFWIEQSRRFSEKSGRGRFVLAQDSSHHVYRDAPDIVLREILALVAECRGE